MYVAICVIELHIPEARGLKEKRKVVKSLIERMHQRFRVSVAETDFHDLHQRAEIGVAAVGRGHGDLERKLEALRRMSEEHGGVVITNWQAEILESMP